MKLGLSETSGSLLGTDSPWTHWRNKLYSVVFCDAGSHSMRSGLPAEGKAQLHTIRFWDKGLYIKWCTDSLYSPDTHFQSEWGVIVAPYRITVEGYLLRRSGYWACAIHTKGEGGSPNQQRTFFRLNFSCLAIKYEFSFFLSFFFFFWVIRGLQWWTRLISGSQS